MPKRATTRYRDPFLDEIHALKKAVSVSARHNIRTLAARANVMAATASRTTRSSHGKDAA